MEGGWCDGGKGERKGEGEGKGEGGGGEGGGREDGSVTVASTVCFETESPPYAFVAGAFFLLVGLGGGGF